jgi:multiple sugar transport system substrate-binding protein
MRGKKHQINRRQFLRGVGALGAGTMVGSILPRQTRAAKKEIRFQNTEADPNTIKYLDAVAAEYEKLTGIGVKMEHLPVGGEAFQKALMGIKTGHSYDIVNLGQIVYFVALATEGHCVSLTDIVKEQGIDDFGPMSLWKYKNEYYFYPYDYNFVSTYYRKDWLEEAGLQPAKTWNEFLTISKRFTKDGHFGLYHALSTADVTDWAGTNILWSNGVNIYGKKWEVILDSPQMKPKVVECLEFLKELFPYMPKGVFQAQFGDLLNAFTTGAVGITFYAGRLVHHLERSAPQLTNKFIMAGFPTPDGKKQAVGYGTDGWVVLKEGQNVKDALKFMRWFVKKKLIGFLLTLPLHYQPVQKSIYRNPVWQADPLVKKYPDVITKYTEYLDPTKTIINSIDTQGPDLSVLPSKVWSAYAIPEMYQNVLMKNMALGEAVDTAASKIRRLSEKN